MALALNTSDALYPYLTYLFAVDDDNTVKELKASTALTVDSHVLLPNSGTPSTTTPYGRSFRTLANGAYNFYGVTFTQLSAANNGPISVFIVTNQLNGSASSRNAFQCTGPYASPGLNIDATGKFSTVGAQAAAVAGAKSAGNIATGGHSFGYTRNGDTANSVFEYLDGALDSNFTGGLSNAAGVYGYSNAAAGFNGIGGEAGQGNVSADWVYIAVFVGHTLTSSDFSRLHSSLTGSNAFALIASGADATPPTQTGSIVASSKTTTDYTLTWPAGADNVAVTGYEYLLDGGTTYTDAGNVLTVNVTGRTPGATDSVKVRCYDAAGNRSTPALTLSVTLNPATGSFVTEPIINNTGTVRASQAVVWSWWPGGRIGAMASITPVNGTGTTDGSGALTVSGLALGAGVLLVAAQVTDATDDDVYYEAGTVA